MRQNGVDADAAERPPQLDTMVGCRFDYVISLCDRVREGCAELPDHPRRAHWSIPNPATLPGDTEEASYPAFHAPALFESITSEVFDQYVGVRVPPAPHP
jgi:ArsR family transcriptional regulator, arsenate/arsenite/antimonite-responsive transcriptional repressor / arsenate reductase (thioredoxin)